MSDHKTQSEPQSENPEPKDIRKVSEVPEGVPGYIPVDPEIGGE